MASVAICTTVSNPNVMSVPPRSLSIVFGTPITGRPCAPCSSAAAPAYLAADRDQAVEVERREVLADALGAVLMLEGVRPRAAQDGAAARRVRASTRS